MSGGTLRLACVALLALGAMAAPAFRPFIPDRYVVVLDDPPVAARFPARLDAMSAAAADYRRLIEAKQGAVLNVLAARHIQVTSQVSNLLNALFVSAPGHSIDELRAIPGVKSVTPMRRLKAQLNRAVQLMNAQAAWTAVGGQSNAGKGIKIAILDSGIDLTNPAFQDSSLTAPSGYPLCSGFPGLTTGVAGAGDSNSCGSYTNSKVIVARSYMQLLGGGTGANPAADSNPDDPFPHDRDGHGTAVAMVAAGNTITAPAVPTSPTSSPLTMQGMAPKAYIGVYKVAGTFGYSNEEVEIQALGDAVKDGMDVISMSYGGLALSDWKSDPLASAFETAATSARPSNSLPGTIPIPVIVVAAGNHGADAFSDNYQTYPSFNTIDSPSNAPDVISVGATTSSHIMQPSLSAVATSAPSNLKNIVALSGDSSFFPSFDGANTAPLVDVSKVGDATACTALPSGSLNNSFALIVYSSCGFQNPANNAQNAGAVGFVYIMPAGTAVAPFGFNAAPTGILEYGPSVSISNADGLNLQSYIDANPLQEVTIDLGGQEQNVTAMSQALSDSSLLANVVAGYSSFGPTPDGQLKPDIVATGGYDPSSGLYGGFYVPTQSIDAYDSGLYSANGFMAVDGTSLSTSLVAGVAALAIQVRAAQIQRGTQVRSLIVNSSAQSVTMDDSANPVDAQWIGAGMLDAGAATSATLTAEPATVSFGILQSSSLPVSPKSITLTNIGSGSATLTPTVSCCTVNGAASSLSGATVAASLSSGTVAASGGTATLTVTLSGSLPAPGEYSGSITFGSSVSLHIPFMLLVGAATPCSSSVPCSIEPNFSPETTVLEGPPGADLGPHAYLQVTDPYGVPVAGAQVTFSVTPSGSLTMNSASGHSACQSAPSTSQIVCPTDQFGWAWMDVVLGTAASQPTINYSAAGIPDFFYVNIQTPPTITPGGVADAASYLTTLVPGSYAVIFGNNFINPSFPVSALPFALQCPTGPCVYPISYDYVSVSFDVPGATYPGLPYAVSEGQYPQVNLVVPWELQGQTSAQVKVTRDFDLLSNVVTVPIATYNPAFIQTCGAACARDLSYNVITTSNPAQRGQYIQLYANSLGPVTNPPGDGVAATGSTLSYTTTVPVVTIGGAVVPPGDVQFSGLAPGFPALYQINVKVPQSAQTGNAVPISLQIGGVTSPTSTVYGPVTIPVK
jgi:minor extracellular serine protease Vpr